ncbi:MAG: UDP-N-acetylmuramate--L-alanine ligase [Flavobacteriia bacterium]|nr:MAG: UDP-N-acetylmuramate--L-alanine ligase [Flavobacteriia bacterium]
MNLSNLHNIYFIGIGGIGMSNLALYLDHMGKKVWGYDKTASPITKRLEDKGIDVYFNIDIERLKAQALDKTTTLIVYTPAIKREEHEELDYLMSNDYKVIKRAQLLAMVTDESICLAVAGTHGKTTTSAILAHILYDSGIKASGFLGGIAENYNTNLILNGSEYTVVEADEYDRSFLQLHPEYACITATDADHLDIYQTQEEFIEGFKQFAAQVKTQVFTHHNAPISGKTFGFETTDDYAALNISIKDGIYSFDVKTPNATCNNIRITLPGRHNIINTLAAISLADSIGVSMTQIKKALATFKGIARRFTYRIKTDERVLIDDYAHHPTELKALYNTVRALYPEDQISIYFQPHTYSRTKDFWDGFVAILSQFDNIYMLPIYAAREHPVEGITSQALAKDIKNIQQTTQLITPGQLLKTVAGDSNRIIVMAGAGDIGEMIIEVTEHLKPTRHA